MVVGSRIKDQEKKGICQIQCCVPLDIIICCCCYHCYHCYFVVVAVVVVIFLSVVEADPVSSLKFFSEQIYLLKDK